MEKREVLKVYFGHEAFRPGQEVLVDALLAGRDALGIMPTGAGKSVCYQVPALMMEGVTLVVSPLISLMKDQVAALKSCGVAAAYLNSSLTPYQMELAMERARQGAYRIIYVAPERLETASFRAFAAGARIAMIAVDEAHCVSQWGQDFRPNYLRIADFIDSLPVRPRVGAFTATATERVKQDVIRLLRLRQPVCMTTGFDRPNLFFEVVQPKSKYAALSALLRHKRGESGIVYCATRKTVEEVTDKLTMEGFSVGRYHAGLSDEERARTQEDFQYDRVQVMVATNAFGMGIDKSNVSFVVHYNMPRSMEAYYQEAGRAGRDGSDAECVLFYGGQDIITGKWMIEHSEPNPDMTAEAQALVRRQDMQRLYQMADYCTKAPCLRAGILRYFGQPAQERCGACNRCTGGHYAALNGVTATSRRGGRASGASPFAYTSAVASYAAPSSAVSSTVGAHAVPAPAEPGRQYSAFEGDDILMPMKPGVRLGHAQEQADDVPGGDSLYDALRACRMELSRALHVPPYVVATDKSLADMARRRPHSPDALLDVYGMGTAKVGKYGQAFLGAIRAWERENGQAQAVRAAARVQAVSRSASAPRPRHPAPAPWTPEEEDRLRRGYQAGVTIPQLAAIHGRTEVAVRKRLQKMGVIFSAANVERYGVAAYEDDTDGEE